MNLKMGSQIFIGVQIPLLWGTRAVVQDQQGRLSVIDLGGDRAKIEILGDKPAPGIEFVPNIDGFDILTEGTPLYRFNPKTKTLTGRKLQLLECQIDQRQIRIGTNIFSANMFSGFDVGIGVSENGIQMGARLPAGLAKLVA